VAHLHFYQTHKAHLKNAKEPPNQRTATRQKTNKKDRQKKTLRHNKEFEKIK
jgi:hypothetical protein